MATEKVKPSLNREDYEDAYSYRAQWLPVFEKDEDMEYYPKSFSFFCKSGSIPISGKVFQPPTPDFKCECDIKECFVKIKEKMVTKVGQPRATMLKLADYEIQAWAQLLDYLRFEWGVLDNRGKVLLTGKEYWMLFGDNKKPKNKKK